MAKPVDLPTLLAAQDWARAEKLLRAAAAKKTASADVFYNLAKVLEAAGKTRQMQQWLKRAVAAKPDYALAWYELGRRALDDNALEDAFTAFRRAHAADPHDRDAARSLGRVALRLGKWDVAAQCFAEFADSEAQLALYRIAAERGEPTTHLSQDLLAQSDLRSEVLKTLTRVAKGRLPMVLDQ